MFYMGYFFFTTLLVEILEEILQPAVNDWIWTLFWAELISVYLKIHLIDRLEETCIICTQCSKKEVMKKRITNRRSQQDRKYYVKQWEGYKHQGSLLWRNFVSRLAVIHMWTAYLLWTTRTDKVLWLSDEKSIYPQGIQLVHLGMGDSVH